MRDIDRYFFEFIEALQGREFFILKGRKGNQIIMVKKNKKNGTGTIRDI